MLLNVLRKTYYSAFEGSDGLILDTAHPQSLQKIREIESMDKFARIEAPEREYGKPQWIQPFEVIIFQFGSVNSTKRVF